MTPSEQSKPSGQPPRFEPASQTDYFSIALDWRRWWTIIPELLILSCTGMLPVVVVTNVIARYTDWYHVLWAEDVIKVLFLWIVFLGGAVAVKYEAHVRMAMLSDRIAPLGRVGGLWSQAIRLSPIVVGGLLLVLGERIVEISMYRELPTLRISVGYFTTIVPVSGALMIFYALHGQLVRNRRRSVSAATPND